jgi:hypothetical protein
MDYNEEKVVIFLKERQTMKESTYQNSLTKKIMALIPDCLVLKNDPRHIQGVPDIIVLYKDKWAALEVKVSDKSRIQPNQQHYVDALGAMSFASFINPDTEEEVLGELQQSFGITRKTCVS